MWAAFSSFHLVWQVTVAGSLGRAFLPKLNPNRLFAFRINTWCWCCWWCTKILFSCRFWLLVLCHVCVHVWMCVLSCWQAASPHARGSRPSVCVGGFGRVIGRRGICPLGAISNTADLIIGGGSSIWVTKEVADIVWLKLQVLVIRKKNLLLDLPPPMVNTVSLNPEIYKSVLQEMQK